MKYITLTLLTFFTSVFADLPSETYLLETSNETASDVHGFFDFSLKNAYITPRGLLVVNTDLTMQILAGLSLDVYKNPCGFINKASIFGFMWNDLWTHQKSCNSDAWVEFDWGVGFSLQFLDRWTFGAQFIEFLSPPGHFCPENNIEFLLAYDDCFLNPYVKVFWAVSGDSTVVTGRRGNTYDVELGLVPTFKGSYTVAFPTWLTLGPPSFWNGGELGLKNHDCCLGVFSTGVDIKFPLTCIPKRLGNWYFDVGGQYYYLINRSLIHAQEFTIGDEHGHRNVGVVHVGLGFDY